jgi:hypothetical protein
MKATPPTANKEIQIVRYGSPGREIGDPSSKREDRYWQTAKRAALPKIGNTTRRSRSIGFNHPATT